MKLIAKTFYTVAFVTVSLLSVLSNASVQDYLEQGLVKSNLKEDRISSARGQNDEVCRTQPFSTLLPFNHFIAL